MASIDVFNQDPFKMVSLTTAINKLPYVPNRIGQMGLFRRQGVNTTVVMLEEQAGKISLLPTAQRGEAGRTTSRTKRKVRAFPVPHIPYDDQILAGAIQDIRAFGTETEQEAVSKVVNDKMQAMRQDHELTHEYHRIGALQGHVLDADGSTVINDLFDEFGVSETTVNFALGTATTDVRKKCLAVTRAIEAVLGAAVYSGIGAVCGADWFDALIGHPYVQDAYHRFMDSENLRNDPRRRFEFGGIVFEEYRGKVGNVDFLPAAQARFFPIGVPDLFMSFDAPADFMETVGTTGQPVYAKQERMKFDRGIEIHTQSNPLVICTRPGVLIKGT